MESLASRHESDAARPLLDPGALANSSRLATAIGGLATLTGAVVLCGWLFDIGALKGILPGFATMKPLTALCLLALGVGLWRAHRVEVPRWLPSGPLLGWSVVVVTTLTLLEYLWGRDWGVDRLLFPAAVRADGSSYPGRMSGATALGLWCLGVALLLQHRTWRGVRPADIPALLAGLIGLIGVEGYLFGAEHLYRFGPYGSMALHTAVLILLLGVGLLFTRPEGGVLAPFVSGFDGGRMARIVLPLALSGVLLIAWLRWLGELAGYYGTAVGLALFATSNLVTIATLTWFGAREVNRADQLRRGEFDRLRLLSAVVESSDDAILTKSMDGTIRSWNRAAERLYGYPAAEAIGRHITLIVPEDRRTELADLMGRVRRGEAVHNRDTVRRARDGHLIDVSLSLSPVSFGPDVPGGIAVIARDITDRKRAEDALRASEVRFRTMVNSLPQLVWTAEPDGTCDFLSQRWMDFAGLQGDEQVGRDWLEQIHPEDRPLTEGRWRQAIERAEAFHAEFRLRQRDGAWRHVDARAVPFVGPSGRVEQWLGAGTDVEDRRQAEQLIRESEERLQTILESLTEGLVVSDLDGQLLHWNRAGIAMHGFSNLNDLLKRIVDFTSIFELSTMDGQVLPVSEWPMPRIIRGEVVRDLDIRIRRLDCEWERLFRYGGAIVVQPGGQRLAVLTITDMTERRLAEEQFRLVVEACPTGMAVVNGSGKLVLVNREMERMFGWQRDDLLGSSIERLLPPAVRGGHETMRAGYLQAPGRRPMGAGRELHGWRRDGSTFPVEVGLNPMRFQGESAVLAIVTDITERQEAARLIERHQRELERSNRELAQFAYVASHDMQEPLRMVSSYTELFAERFRGQLDEKADKYIGYITSGAHRMQQLIRDLLAYARVDSQGKALQPVRPGALAKVTLHDLAGPIRESGAEIVVDELPEVWADAGQLQQVLQNLVGNAIKFRGAAPPRIRVSARSADGVVEFAVIDNGIGIDPEYAERVFGMFQRLHGRDEFEGSGIGLSIARRIVERHGGRIWVEPAPTGGTAVRFTLRPTDAPRPDLTSTPRS